jgi:hypothetical protein
MNRAIRIILILSIAFISGCYYDNEERLYPKQSSPCDDTLVTFSGTVTTILQPCLLCHATSSSAGGGFYLQKYSDVQKYVISGQLMNSLNHIGGHDMPIGGGKLADFEIKQIQKWIDNKSPNN